MSPKILPSRTAVLVVSAASATILTRLLLLVFPGSGGSPILGVHIHHLLMGILLICVGGIPAVLIRPGGLLKTLSVAAFGFGLGLALDEWVLFVLREAAPDTPYMAPWSVAGAAIMISLFVAYTLAVNRFAAARKQS